MVTLFTSDSTFKSAQISLHSDSICKNFMRMSSIFSANNRFNSSLLCWSPAFFQLLFVSTFLRYSIAIQLRLFPATHDLLFASQGTSAVGHLRTISPRANWNFCIIQDSSRLRKKSDTAIFQHQVLVLADCSEPTRHIAQLDTYED
jgi:hypothetical protein